MHTASSAALIFGLSLAHMAAVSADGPRPEATVLERSGLPGPTTLITALRRPAVSDVTFRTQDQQVREILLSNGLSLVLAANTVLTIRRYGFDAATGEGALDAMLESGIARLGAVGGLKHFRSTVSTNQGVLEIGRSAVILEATTRGSRVALLFGEPVTWAAQRNRTRIEAPSTGVTTTKDGVATRMTVDESEMSRLQLALNPGLGTGEDPNVVVDNAAALTPLRADEQAKDNTTLIAAASPVTTGFGRVGPGSGGNGGGVLPPPANDVDDLGAGAAGRVGTFNSAIQPAQSRAVGVHAAQLFLGDIAESRAGSTTEFGALVDPGIVGRVFDYGNAVNAAGTTVGTFSARYFTRADGSIDRGRYILRVQFTAGEPAVEFLYNTPASVEFVGDPAQPGVIPITMQGRIPTFRVVDTLPDDGETPEPFVALQDNPNIYAQGVFHLGGTALPRDGGSQSVIGSTFTCGAGSPGSGVPINCGTAASDKQILKVLHGNSAFDGETPGSSVVSLIGTIHPFAFPNEFTTNGGPIAIDDFFFLQIEGCAGDCTYVYSFGTAPPARALDSPFSLDRYYVTAGLTAYEDAFGLDQMWDGTTVTPGVRAFGRNGSVSGLAALLADDTSFSDTGLWVLNPAGAASSRPVLHADLGVSGNGAGQLSTISLTLGNYTNSMASGAPQLLHTVGTIHDADGGVGGAGGSSILFGGQSGITVSGSRWDSWITENVGDPLRSNTGALVDSRPTFLVVQDTVPGQAGLVGGRESPLGLAEDVETSLLRLATLVQSRPVTPTRTTSSYQGFLAGLVESETPSGIQVGQLDSGSDASGLSITTDRDTHQVTVNAALVGPSGQSISTALGGTVGPSTFLFDGAYGAQTAVGAQNAALVASGVFEGDLPAVLQPVQFHYLQWGFFFGDVSTTPDGRIHAPMVPWVAGTPASDDMIPSSQRASYQGHAIGNIVSGSNTYTAVGDFENTWDFARRRGTVQINGLDGANYSGTTQLSASGPSQFIGSLAGGGRAGGLAGQFFQGVTPAGTLDPIAAVAGSFAITGPSYAAVGVFGGDRQ